MRLDDFPRQHIPLLAFARSRRDTSGDIAMLGHRSRALMGALLAGVSALSLVATAPAALAESPAQSAWAGGSLADLIEQVSPAVVQITARHPGSETVLGEDDLPDPFRYFFGREFGFPDDQQPQQRQPGRPPRSQQRERGPEVRAGGSGFLIDRDGTIVTNNHVVDKATHVSVTLKDGREFDAKVLGTDPKTDIAVLKIKADNLPNPVRWGDSEKARVGESIFAMGAPFDLGGTVTAGIISARSRYLGGNYDDFIQIDAPINPGNSGGPLFNSNGEVIGVNSQIFSPSGGNVGIGFAIPSSIVKAVAQQIVQHGSVERGFLGVSIQPVTKDIAESLGLADAKGALVAEVNEKSPAERAGLQVQDVIVQFGDKPVKDVHDLTRYVADAHDGDHVRLSLIRDGKTRDVDVAIARMQGDGAKLASRDTRGERGGDGLALDRLGLSLDNDDGAVVVSDVSRGGPADEAGLQAGDHVVRVNDTEVKTAKQAQQAVADAAEKHRTAVLLQIERDGQKRFVGVPFAAS
jgi:serine protease Do